MSYHSCAQRARQSTIQATRSSGVRGTSRVKIWMAIALMMFAAVGHAGNAEGYYLSGSDLLQECESDAAFDRNVCMGYVMGIADVTRSYVTLGHLNKYFCIPDAVDSIQLQKVIIKRLNANPEELHLSASSLVAKALYEAFPCD